LKGQILKILRKTSGVVSRETLSAGLGVSRITVWQHVHKLRQLGYPITSTPKGYQLMGDPDTLYPWEFPDRQSKIHYFPEVTSTMDIARGLARDGCPDFTVVIAGRQKKGRGRLKRSWHSIEGGLYLSIVLRPALAPVSSPRVSFCASLALVLTLRKMFKIEAVVKWPNDILVAGRKVSGMLSEMEAEADRINFINLGVGINVNNDPTRVEPRAISLKQILDRPVSRKELLSKFLDELENRMALDRLENVITEWKRFTITLNKHVKIVTIHDVSEGKAVDVDDNGALILELADGSIKKIIHGDCFHQ
jgi:BirA family biotin operon repressor/biotin-[acetyl-CoA-carboxylase] ligase